MGNVVSFSPSCSRPTEPKTETRILTEFWLLAEADIRADLMREAQRLQRLGYKPHMIEETADDRGGHHLTILYAGVGMLRHFFYAFTIRDRASSQSVSAEIKVLTSDLSITLHKVISTVSYEDYTRQWFDWSWRVGQDDTSFLPSKAAADR
jgi:hypothetical protein